MQVRAILFDIEGTLISCGKLIPGSLEAVQYARTLGMEIRFLTNMTNRSSQQIANELTDLGIVADALEVQTSTSACLSLLKKRPGLRCHFMVPPSIVSVFDEIVRDDIAPDVLVIGDLAEGFNYAAMNKAFLILRAGAELIVFHKNLFWFDTTEAKLDSGAFVLALEAASNKKATITGKPSREFFETAIAGLRCNRDQVLIVGDDLNTDIAGGNLVNVRTVLVGTGKYADGQVKGIFKEDYFLESVRVLPDFLDRLNA